MRIRCLLTFLVVVATAPALAAGGLEKGESARVRAVVDGDTVVLDHEIDGAAQVRLVGIQAPKLPLGRPDFPVWPLAEEAKQVLETLVLGKTVTLSYGGRRMDRHGRLLAHLHDDAGTWIQGELLRLGMARVYSFPDNRAVVSDMLALEGAARAAGTGIWGDPFYAVRGAGAAGGFTGTFQLVEGRVADAAKVRSRVYLNFGPDWRTDFTISIAPRAMRLFRKADLDPLALKGRRVRVRGWLRDYNGPLIEATHPEQIEVAAD